LIDKTSSIYLYVKLKALASWIFLCFTRFWRNSDLYDYKNKSARRGAHFVPIGMPTTSRNSAPPKETNMLSMRNSNILITCSSNKRNALKIRLYTSLTPSPFIEVPELSQEWSFICVRDIEFTYFYDFSIECWNCSDSVIYIFSFYYRLWKQKTAELQLLKKNMVVIRLP
jgi:hypothetical protein